MSVVDEEKVSGQKYLCSNPNCRKVFSKPKIIKYEVCPNCQTLVTSSRPEGDPEIQAALGAQKSTKHRKAKTTKVTSPGTAVSIQTDNSHVSVQEQNPLEQKNEENNASITPENAPVPVAQPVTVELIQTQKVDVVKIRKASQSSSGCEYGFGYLSQRGRGEAIPENCLECPKSLDCMLSRIYEKDQSVKEIKKWYKF